MKTHVAKWGNSLAVRLPRAAAEEMRLSEGSTVEIKVEAGALVLRPSRPRYALADLLTGLTPRAMRAAWRWGSDRGREAAEE